MSKNSKKRVAVKGLPKAEKKLSNKAMKKVKGGGLTITNNVTSKRTNQFTDILVSS